MTRQMDEIKETIAELKAAIKTLTATADRVHDTRSAAEFVGMAVGTLEVMRVRGGGPPFFKIGKSVRYRQSDLIAWLESRPGMRSTAESKQ